MTKHSLRAKWNEANAILANKPFDDLFNEGTLKLLEFITSNNNWEALLSNAPYSLDIKRDGEYIMFCYNMIESDFSLELVREARGIIFHEPTWTPVCVPFFKFFNVQEGHASEIDWSTAIVEEKLDGSLIKLWYHNGEWRLSTNGTINAQNAPLQVEFIVDGFYKDTLQNYHDLFMFANGGLLNEDWLDELDKRCTYLFELTSEFNKIVVPYKESKIYHIGTRDNWTLKEFDVDIGIEKPKTYSLRTLEDCLESAEQLSFSEEGYVVRDANFNRVKIKGIAYVAVHHLRGNGVFTNKRILEVIKRNGQDDLLSYYPEYTNNFNEVQSALNSFIGEVNATWTYRPDEVKNPNISRKEFAMWATKSICPPAMFLLYDQKIDNIPDWLFSLQSEKILEWIRLKE